METERPSEKIVVEATVVDARPIDEKAAKKLRQQAKLQELKDKLNVFIKGKKFIGPMFLFLALFIYLTTSSVIAGVTLAVIGVVFYFDPNFKIGKKDEPSVAVKTSDAKPVVKPNDGVEKMKSAFSMKLGGSSSSEKSSATDDKVRRMLYGDKK